MFAPDELPLFMRGLNKKGEPCGLAFQIVIKTP